LFAPGIVIVGAPKCYAPTGQATTVVVFSCCHAFHGECLAKGNDECPECNRDSRKKKAAVAADDGVDGNNAAAKVRAWA
jgi:hypothetical protein